MKPVTGLKDNWLVKPPFDTEILSTRAYTVSSTKTFLELEADGVDIFNLVYKRFGLTNDQLEEDKSNNEIIVTFASNSGKWISVPSSFVIGGSRSTGVKYIGKGLVFNLGPLPKDEDLTMLIEDIKEELYDRLGIHPSCLEVTNSDINLVSTEYHNSLTDRRNSSKTVFKSLKAQVLELKVLVNKQKDSINTITDYLIMKKNKI